MPLQVLRPGIAIVVRRDLGKDHYGLLDVGGQLGYPTGVYAAVFDLSPLKVRFRPFVATEWQIIGWTHDVHAARTRFTEACADSTYRLFDNNCEHFARYVVSGTRESTQVKSLLAVACVIGLIMLLRNAA